MSDTDCVRVCTTVSVDPATAFDVFTTEIDRWWRREPRYRASGERRLCFEPGAGGRLIGYRESGASREIGRVTAWKPAEHLAFEWRAESFAPGQVTVVDVRFQAVAQGTRITLEHSGWDAIPAHHPVRHGLMGEAFRAMFGLWWADLLVSLRAHAPSAASAA